jgi:hypothetical protein
MRHNAGDGARARRSGFERRFIVGRLVAVVLVLVGATIASSADVAARTRCSALRTSGGSFGNVRVTVRIDRGPVGCSTAHAIARRLFDGRARRVNGNSGATSYSVVSYQGQRWRGDARMNAWIMSRCRRLDGCGRVISGTFEQE